LNPGDMFQVDPETVMFATGAPKNKQSPAKEPKAASEESGETQVEAAESAEATEEGEATATSEADSVKIEDAEIAEAAEAETGLEEWKAPKRELWKTIRAAKGLLSTGAEKLSVKQKKELRSFYSNAKKLVSKAGRSSSSADDIMRQLQELVEKKNASAAKYNEALAKTIGSATTTVDATTTTEKTAAAEAPATPSEETPELISTSKTPVKKGAQRMKLPSLAAEERKQLSDIMARLKLEQQDADNPIDHSKPYKTPWEPRPYMAPFAFIPRYLEVNHTVCSAVYLRHPVARPGLAEVPSPFPVATGQLAWAWYLRRR
jgi:hypothetical protein